jgi:hypothetical protein
MLMATRQHGLGNDMAIRTITNATSGASTGLLVSSFAGGPIGAAVGAAAFALTMLFTRKGPQQRVATTQVVNDLEPILRQNVDGYLSGPRTPESQAAALQNFDQGWAYLVSAQACGNSQMGNPGKACISDRARGGQFDWHRLYRDPIASDVPVSGVVEGAGRELYAALGVDPTGFDSQKAILVLGLVLAGIAVARSAS